MNKAAIIMLAWPETPAIQVGSWYEPVMKLLGFNQNGYYKAGHSALVLVDASGKLHYFDFGRYHTPLKHGRVRNEDTDPNLQIAIKAEFNNQNRIANLENILLTLSKQKDFHGYGKMYASIQYEISFEKSYRFAKQQQQLGAIPYGPFAYKGTNCSRFTSRVFRAGVDSLYKKIQGFLPFSFTPTPIGNVLIASYKNYFYKVENTFVKRKRANIFTFLAHWTLPPIKAVPINLKGFDQKSTKMSANKALIN